MYHQETLEMQKLDMRRSLAENEKTVIPGDTSNSLLSKLLVAKLPEQRPAERRRLDEQGQWWLNA
ncbi:hypothetical protein KXD40_004398 [Peronospora effusa]|uniref:Uncharacterized protein n=1 Tax=Peronospora effusa TaxID=542832 RepID=A0A3M6VPG9_9STRA|nr:hypothetical protein DD238_000148 [Peronospora effusa]RQM18123.1 hypothetical protein DD237_000208 [Peronospora effusa]UIZ28133.1 hypothetical protein KXD40_004398 [Peronospora effusa]